jgi:hypothetical protein
VTSNLQRLAALRRLREQQAMEALSIQVGLVRQAEHRAEEAERSMQNHVRKSAARERELVGKLAGRAVSLMEIARTQLELDAAVFETTRLRADVAQAQADVATRRSARAEALAKYQSRQRATAKLDIVCKQEAARQTRWNEAVGEAEIEDRHHPAPGGRLP